MPKNFIILVLVIFSQVSYGQGTLLYDSLGRLRCDTFYQIDVENLTIMRKIENDLYVIYKSIEYPKEAYENEIYGLVIAKISIDTKKVNVSCEIVYSPDPIFEKPIKKAIYDNQITLLRNSLPRSNLTIYIPIEFEKAERFLDELRKYRTIKIRKYYQDNMQLL